MLAAGIVVCTIAALGILFPLLVIYECGSFYLFVRNRFHPAVTTIRSGFGGKVEAEEVVFPPSVHVIINHALFSISSLCRGESQQRSVCIQLAGCRSFQARLWSFASLKRELNVFEDMRCTTAAQRARG